MTAKLRKAVFPVAGLGSRFLPATKASPKEMLPVVDKPLIQYAVEEAAAAGITDMIFITGRNKRAIEDHFDKAYELETELEQKGKHALLDAVRGVLPREVRCIYIRQAEPLGLGHAVLCAQPVVGDEPFAVMLGDDIIDSAVPCMKQMIDVFERHDGPVIAVQQVPHSEISAYGVIDGEPEGDGGRVYRIRDMVEKPKPAEAPSDLAIIGRYLLPPSIFPALLATKPGAGGEIQLTDAIRSLIGKERVIGIEFEGVRYDAGTKLGFQMANVAFALKDPELGPGLRAFLKKEKLT